MRGTRETPHTHGGSAPRYHRRREKRSSMSTASLQVNLGPTGLESPLSEMEAMMQANVRRFAETVMRPIGERLDRMSPQRVIAPDSPLWQFLAESAQLGMTTESIFSLGCEERGRLMPLLFEEFGWGDAGLACMMGAAMAPWMILHYFGRNDLLARYPEGSGIGC